VKVVLWKIVGSMSDPFHKEVVEAKVSLSVKEWLAQDLEMGANMAPGEVQEIHLILVVEA
jgi:hypothetical protein